MTDAIINHYLTKKIYFHYAKLGLESNEMRVLRQAIKIKGSTFLDIGACHGMYSFWLVPNFKKVIAFEPDTRNHEILKLLTRTLRQYKIKIIKKAVSGEAGFAKFFISDNVFNHTINPEYASSNQESVIIETICLNDFVKEDIDLVKVDVQGVAIDILEGANKAMPKIHRWIIELEKYEQEKKPELENMLQSYGYKTIWLSFQHIYAFKVNIDPSVN